MTQATLFDAPNPAAWRAPTAGEATCHRCAGAACYADGATFYCMACAPAGFLPKTRGAK